MSSVWRNIYLVVKRFETRLEETGTDFTTTLEARRNRKTAQGADRAIFE